MSYNSQQTVFGVGFKPQTDLHTANAETDFWRISKGTGGFAKIDKVRESNAAEMGKGSEFATQSFDVNWDVSGSMEKYLSSELAAWAFYFGLGNPLITYADGAYTVHEAPRATDWTCRRSPSWNRSAPSARADPVWTAPESAASLTTSASASSPAPAVPAPC